MFTIILTILIAIYALVIRFRTGLLGWKKIGLNEKRTRQLRNFHLFLLGLLLILWILATREIYLRGYWTTKILIWSFFVTGVLIFAFGKKEIQRKTERRYFGFFFWSPLSLFPLFFLNPYGVFALLLYLQALFGSRSQILFHDPKYRIQKTYAGEGYYRNSLFVKKGILEFKEKPLRVSVEHKSYIDSISVHETPDDSLRIKFYFKPFYHNKIPYELAVKTEH